MTGRAQTETRLPSIRRRRREELQPGRSANPGRQARMGRHRSMRMVQAAAGAVEHIFGTRGRMGRNAPRAARSRARWGAQRLRPSTQCRAVVAGRRRSRPSPPMLPRKTGIHGKHAGPDAATRPTRIASHAPGGVQAARNIDGLTRSVWKHPQDAVDAFHGTQMRMCRSRAPRPTGLVHTAGERLLSGTRSGWCSYTCLSPHDAWRACCYYMKGRRRTHRLPAAIAMSAPSTSPPVSVGVRVYIRGGACCVQRRNGEPSI
jgi:hypothetical protein